MKTKIYEFDPVIYPTRLWVCKKPITADIEELFYAVDNHGDLHEDFGEIYDDIEGKLANTMIVGNKDSRMRGCIVSLFNPKECGAGICSHEALHFLAWLNDQLDISLGDFDTSEPSAYLEQWATNCIYSVLRGHPEKMKGVKVE